MGTFASVHSPSASAGPWAAWWSYSSPSPPWHWLVCGRDTSAKRGQREQRWDNRAVKETMGSLTDVLLRRMDVWLIALTLGDPACHWWCSLAQKTRSPWGQCVCGGWPCVVSVKNSIKGQLTGLSVWSVLEQAAKHCLHWGNRSAQRCLHVSSSLVGAVAWGTWALRTSCEPHQHCRRNKTVKKNCRR